MRVLYYEHVRKRLLTRPIYVGTSQEERRNLP